MSTPPPSTWTVYLSISTSATDEELTATAQQVIELLEQAGATVASTMLMRQQTIIVPNPPSP